jgi:hypothetical protein
VGRHHQNFIQAYVDKHQDNFVPNKFYLWSAISVVAAAMERKVWLPWGNINFYPNMYIFLVSRPGVGKSSAIRPGQKIIKKVNTDFNRLMRLLPNKITEPKLLEMLGEKDFFLWQGTHYPHTSVYYIASEASTCFNDPYGGFTQTITALYDGDDISKATVSRPLPIHIENPCVNIIAGCTFDYLSRLLTTEGILGGFASRITYVVQDEIMERKSEWQEDTKSRGASTLDAGLVADLAAINAMTGPFTASPEFQEAWNEWFPVFDKAYQAEESEKLQALMVRKPTAMHKLPMILSAAESDDRILRLSHWNNALALIDEVEEKIPGMIRQGQAGNTQTGEGRNSAIFKALKERNGEMTQADLIVLLTSLGHGHGEAASALSGLMANDSVIKVIGGKLHLMINPDKLI